MPPRGAIASVSSRSPFPLLYDWMLVLPAITLLLPLFAACALLLRYSFDVSSAPGSATEMTWTLHNFQLVLGDSFYLGVLINTLWIGAIVTALSLLLAYPLAYVIAISRWKKLLILLVVVSLWMDGLVRAYGWILLLSLHGPVNDMLVGLSLINRPVRLLATPTAVVLVLLHEVLPFMVLILASIIQRIDPALREAAMNLGASPQVAFLRMTLPLSVTGVLASTMLTFSLAISAFTGPLLLGGYRVPFMSLVINQQMTYSLNWPLGSAEAVILTLLVVILLSLYTYIMRTLPTAN